MADKVNTNFQPQNLIPTTAKEISEENQFQASVNSTLAKAEALLNGKVQSADAANQDGDTLHLSDSNKKQPTTRERIYLAFQMGVDQAKNLIKTADGMKSYDKSTGWAGYPERGITDGPKAGDAKATQQVQWGKGLNEDYTPHSSVEGVEGEQTFIKSNTDGGIDRNESELAIQQLVWDESIIQKSASADTRESQLNAAGNAKNLLHNIHDKQGNVHSEFDINNNNVFDAEDAEKLATLVDETGDGQAILSSDDLDQATTDFIMKGVTHKQPLANDSELAEYKGDFTGQQVMQYFNFAAKTPAGQENDIRTHNLTLAEAKSADRELQQIAQLRTSDPAQFEATLTRAGISENNFDQILEFSRQMLTNDGKLHGALMQQFRGDVDNAITTTDMGYAANTKEPETDPNEAKDMFYLNNNEIKHIVKNYDN